MQYRLAGNIFESKFYIPQTQLAEAHTAANEILTGMSLVQTSDVEYLAATLTFMAPPFTATPLLLSVVNGVAVGSTAPSITFLVFTFRPVVGSGKVTHYIRGYAANDYTDLGVWNIGSTGLGDVDGSSTIPAEYTAYGSLESSIADNSSNRGGEQLVGTHRISIGSRRATKRL